METKPVILCMYWGNWGDGLAKKYVSNLRNMCRRNSTVDFDFFCITDRDFLLKDVNVIKMPNNIVHWRFNLPKFYMHKSFPELKGRRILFFDLDTVITGNIDAFLSYEGYLCTIKPFNQVNWKKNTPGGILSFVNGETEWLWHKVNENVHYWEQTTGGKERLILNRLEPQGQWDRWQDLFPNYVVSYKRHIRKGRIPDDMRVIAFHGNPRPHEVQDLLIKNNWK